MGKLLKKSVCSVNKGSNPVIKSKETFNLDIFGKGACIRVSHQSGLVTNAIISDAQLDYIEAYRLDITGTPVKLEIYLEEYLSGVWIIRRLC